MQVALLVFRSSRLDMTLAQAIVLGAVQGMTKFLPISSSAHLILVPWILGWRDQGLTLDVVLHAGTLIAILSFFWKDWLQIWRFSGRPQPSTFTTCDVVPDDLRHRAGRCRRIFGSENDRDVAKPLLLSITMIGVALLLWLAERVARGEKALGQVSLSDALSIRSAQALALILGTSRSGITTATGPFRGLTSGAAARFSYFCAHHCQALCSRNCWVFERLESKILKDYRCYLGFCRS